MALAGGHASVLPTGERNGLWEIWTALPTKRTARVLLYFYREHLVALHGFIKKTQTTPEADLTKACQYQNELER